MKKICILTILVFVFSLSACRESSFDPENDYSEIKDKLTANVWVFDSMSSLSATSDPGPLTIQFLDDGNFISFCDEPSNDWGYWDYGRMGFRWIIDKDGKLIIMSNKDTSHCPIKHLNNSSLIFTSIVWDEYDQKYDTTVLAYKSLYKDNSDSTSISLQGSLNIKDNSINLDDMTPVLLWLDAQEPTNAYLWGKGTISNDKKSFSISINSDLVTEALRTNEPDTHVGQALVALVKKSDAIEGEFIFNNNLYGVIKDRFVIFWKGTRDNKEIAAYRWLWPLGFRHGYTYAKTDCYWHATSWRWLVPVQKNNIELLVTKDIEDYRFVK